MSCPRQLKRRQRKFDIINIYRFCIYSFICVVYQDFILLQGILAPQWEQVEGCVKSSHLLNHLWGNTETQKLSPELAKYVLTTQKLWTPKNPIICGKHSKYWRNFQIQTQRWKILLFSAIPSDLLIHALRDKYNRRSNHPKARFSPLRLVANEIQPLLLIREHHKRKWSNSIFILSLSKYKKIVEFVNRWLRRHGTVLGVSKVATYYFLLLPLVHCASTASCYFLVHPLTPLRPTQSDSELNQLDSKCAWIWNGISVQ